MIIYKLFTPPGASRGAPGGWRKPGGNSVCFDHQLFIRLTEKTLKQIFSINLVTKINRHKKLNVFSALNCSFEAKETDLCEWKSRSVHRSSRISKGEKVEPEIIMMTRCLQSYLQLDINGRAIGVIWMAELGTSWEWTAFAGRYKKESKIYLENRIMYSS